MSRNLFCRGATVGFAALVAVVSLAGCGGGDSDQEVSTVDIDLGDYTISPNTLTIDTGVVNLRVTNTGNVAHNLTVGGRGTRNLAAGQEQTLSVDLAAGSYRMWCDVVGHVELGQTGTLRVVDPAAAVLP